MPDEPRSLPMMIVSPQRWEPFRILHLPRLQQHIQNVAYDYQRALESNTQVVVDRLEGQSPPGWEISSTL